MTINPVFNQVAFQRKSKLFIPEGVAKPSKGMVGAILKNVAEYGYILSEDLVAVLSTHNDSDLQTYYFQLIDLIQEQIVYSFKHFSPMYPNFPEQVATASDEELYINAIVHYLGDLTSSRNMPLYDLQQRFPLVNPEKQRVTWIGLATWKEVSQDIFVQLCTAKSSPSLADIADIRKLMPLVNNTAVLKGSQFANKERLAHVAYANYIHNGKRIILDIVKQFKTATDVLRFVVILSNPEGDASLAHKEKFKKFSRYERRFILNVLDCVNPDTIAEDMYRNRMAWIRLGEIIHPAEHKQYEVANKGFAAIRTNGSVSTFNSKVDFLTRNNEWYEVVKLLKTRAGEFARRLNSLLEKSNNKFVVIDEFKKVATKVSTPVLWQLYGYWQSRELMNEYSNRIFIPMAQHARAVSVKNSLKPLGSWSFAMFQVVREALVEKYSKLDSPFGEYSALYIDPICNSLLVPFGNRSASKAMRQVGRGSRFDVGNDKTTIRLFVYWKDIDNGTSDSYYDSGRVDLDLSATMFDKDWKNIGQCSWTQLRSGDAMYHSGDITSAPNGASEFLDINLDKLDSNVAYIATNVYCYTGQSMNQLDVGFAGWMLRDNTGSGEIFEPTTVANRFDLTSKATSTCPMVYDVASRQMIWADLDMTLNGSCYSTESTLDKSLASVQLISRYEFTKPSLKDVFEVLAEAHKIELVNNDLTDEPYATTYVIAEDGDVSPYDLNKIMSDFL